MGGPTDLSHISKYSRASTPAEKMQGVLLHVGTVLHGNADSQHPLKSFGPVSSRTCQFPSSLKHFRKDEARQEVQKNVPTTAPPVIQEIIGTAQDTQGRCLCKRLLLAKKPLLKANRNLEFSVHVLCLRAIAPEISLLKRKAGLSTCLFQKYLLKTDLPKGHL